MSLCVGLDIGTTTVGAVIFDTATGRLAASCTLPHTARTGGVPADDPLAAELDLRALRSATLECLARAISRVGRTAQSVCGIGVTGQMHGVALLDAHGDPVAPVITWQDRRVEEAIPGEGCTWLDAFIERAGGPGAFDCAGCMPAAGYLGPTLYRLVRLGQLPAETAAACFIPDATVTFLTGATPCTDPTDAASSGVFDVRTRQWHWPIIDRLGLPANLLPEVRPSGAHAGELLPDAAEQTGLPAGTPVFGAVGDNQASFLGSVRGPGESLLLNVGTGSQISAVTDSFAQVPGLEVRPFVDERCLVVGGGLFGGRSYASLRDFFRSVGASFFGAKTDDELYDEMTRLAAEVPPGCEGVRCSPLFTGTRDDPSLRGAFTGLAPHTFTPGHVTRALLEGIAEAFYAFYERMRPVVGERGVLVGSGNAVRKNRLLAEILSRRFGAELHIPALREEAAVGAALMAAVGAGEFRTPREAAQVLEYEDNEASRG